MSLHTNGSLELPADLDRAIRSHAERAYPSECCGILYGRDIPGHRTVVSTEPVENDFELGEQFHRFSIPPAALLSAERSARNNGLEILGFYHSHPDHPAQPSDFDRAHAWPFYSYLIVSVAKGRSEALTAWRLNEGTQQFESNVVLVQ
jgi:proteasome lid subunit RPN8/RPN11